MNRKELNKTIVPVSNWKNPLVSMVYLKYFSVVRDTATAVAQCCVLTMCMARWPVKRQWYDTTPRSGTGAGRVAFQSGTSRATPPNQINGKFVILGDRGLDWGSNHRNVRDLGFTDRHLTIWQRLHGKRGFYTTNSLVLLFMRIHVYNYDKI